MYVYGVILLVHSVRGVDFNVSGELAFYIKIGDAIEDRRPWSLRGKKSEEPESRELSVVSKKPRNETGRCLYEHPKNKQVNRLLSNMMNVLTKIFTRTRKLREPRAHARAHHRSRVRFRVVADKGSTYFDEVYYNMTQEFRSFYQRAGATAGSRDAGPCERRRRLWRALLRRSRAQLRRAAAGLIRQQLETAPPGRDARLRSRLSKALRREMSSWRSRQLHWVCRRRRRCHEDLASRPPTHSSVE